MAAKRKALEASTVTVSGRMKLSELFHGEQFAAVRDTIARTGEYKTNGKILRVKTRPISGSKDHEVLAIAAVSRDPGRSDDFLLSIQDFQGSTKSRSQVVDQYWNIYKNEGLVNNAVNKIAAILSAGGTFRVKRAKKGKKQKAVEQLLLILDWWTRNLNASAENSVVTGARGLKAVSQQGVRQALVEGSWVGRSVWVDAEVPGQGRFDLPMNIQSLSTSDLEPLKGVAGIGDAELFYWKPSREFVRQLTNADEPEVKKFLQKYVPRDMVTKLKKDGKVLLDPALLTHIRNRGNGREQFGESFIHAALNAIAYRRSIEQLDLVSMQNIINRLTIVMVGSSDPKSPYSKVEVAQARAALMQSFFDDPGPNMTIIWQGDDVKVTDVGAHDAVLELDDRHRIADGKVKVSLGVPDALLSGTTDDGKAAGWAAAIGAAAQLEELQNAFSQAWTTLGERIALENGFTDIDLVYEFSHAMIVDRVQERQQIRNDYITGVVSIRTYLEGIGRDPDAEYQAKCQEQGLNAGAALWKDVFLPPQGLQGQGEGKVPGEGRAPNGETGKTGPERSPGTTTTENK